MTNPTERGNQIRGLLDAGRRSSKEYQDLQRLLIRFTMERFLYRLSVSEYRDVFILKGAMLLEVYLHTALRTTKDVDFLMYGDFSADSVKRMLGEACAIDYDDGLIFDGGGIKVAPAGKDRQYPGFQAEIPASLGDTRSSFGIDIAFGEAVTPKAARITYPSMLEFPAPEIRVYPLPTIIAEKFEAMVHNGLGNRRMKDYYDLWAVAQNCELEGAVVQAAILATFGRRGTAVPNKIPQGIGEGFYNAKRKKQEWKEFLRTYGLRKSLSFEEVCLCVQSLVMPVAEACAAGADFTSAWRPAGWRPAGWRPRGSAEHS